MNERVIKGSRKKCKHGGKEGNQIEEGDGRGEMETGEEGRKGGRRWEDR